MRRYGAASRERAAQLTVEAMAGRTLTAYLECLTPARAAELAVDPT
jgi:hypothetical protein